MPLLNVEIKARYRDADFLRRYFLKNGAEFRGTDHQTDTYFNVANGRLKLREGNIENNLIYYEREDLSGPKNSHFQLVDVANASELKEILSKSLGIKIVIRKKRDIYFIANVKFHMDEVPGLGQFVEIEASNKYAGLAGEILQQQCNFYMQELGIRADDLIRVSYSDLLLENAKP
jgi:adenylate cyclase class 2